MCVCVWLLLWCVSRHCLFFPYNTLCRLFWWDCALHVYRISYLGQYVSCEHPGHWWAHDKCTLLLLLLPVVLSWLVDGRNGWLGVKHQITYLLVEGSSPHDVQWSHTTKSRAGTVSELFVAWMILIINLARRTLFLRPQNDIVRSWERLSLGDPVRLTWPSNPLTSGKGLFLFVEAGIHMSGRQLVAGPILSSRCRNLRSVPGMTSEHYRRVRQKGCMYLPHLSSAAPPPGDHCI